jgi:hypothetical protein
MVGVVAYLATLVFSGFNLALLRVALPFFVSVYMASLPMVGAMTSDDVRIIEEILSGLRSVSSIVTQMLGSFDSVAVIQELHYCH